MTDYIKQLESKVKDFKNTNTIFDTRKYILLEDAKEVLNQALTIHVVGSSFYTLEEWGQGSQNRGIIGTYKTREDAEKDRTDTYWQHIKEHKFK